MEDVITIRPIKFENNKLNLLKLNDYNKLNLIVAAKRSKLLTKYWSKKGFHLRKSLYTQPMLHYDKFIVHMSSMSVYKNMK